ncbi:MAG: ribonuclease J [Thermoflexales bacterium]|nr:ribonuclease J [Thermoflexales bacterium]
MAERLRIIPLGGLGEVGKNMLAIEYGPDILLIDAGIMFPENDMMGIDFIIPDWQYLRDKSQHVQAIVLTHGHEDHIGALPYLLNEINVPVYATRLTCGLIEGDLKRRKLLDKAILHTVAAGESVSIGPFQVEFFRVCHSIPDAVGLGITTPAGLIVHSGDFKFDHTPVNGQPSDTAKLAEFGGRGVLALLSDSTNAEKPGSTPSERVVDAALEQVFQSAPGRIIVSTFASLISRVQQVADAAARHERKLIIAGRSMSENARIAQKLGYLNMPPDILMTMNDVSKLDPTEIVLMVTGAQGEPSAVLARISTGHYGALKIVPGDTVIVSAHPIPGNEEMVHRTINRLFQRGAQVLYDPIAPVHVSGHASQEEQKLMLSLVKPAYFIPIHGELRHLKAHARLAQQLGLSAQNIFAVENGHAIEFNAGEARISERVPGGYVYVDGSSVGEVGQALLRDREKLGRDGFATVVVQRDAATGEITGQPEIITRGFVVEREAEDLLAGAEITVIEALKSTGGLPASALEEKIRQALSEYLYRETRRRPMVIPAVIE